MTAARTATRTTVGKALGPVLAALFGAAALAGCSTGGAVTTHSPEQWLVAAAEPGVVVIDVRTPLEYAAGHVEDAINMDVESGDFATQLAKLDPEGEYAVYCQSGRRSGIAASTMEDAGLTTVHNLKGGIADLQAAGAPIVTG